MTSKARRIAVLGLLSLLFACAPGQPTEAGLGASPVTQLVVSPNPASVPPGGTVTFSAVATHEDGTTSVPSISWSASGGVITANGLYTAGPATGAFQATATLVGGSVLTNVPINISSTISPTVSLSVTPGSATVAPGETQFFSVLATRQDGSTYTPSVSWSATGGTISNGGLYTAGSTEGSFRAIATLQGGSLADTSAVSVIAPFLQAVVLTPSNTTIYTGMTLQFSATGQWSDGSTTPLAATFNATGGSISNGGLYTGGNTTGTFRVIAVQQGGTLADTSTITLSVAPPPDMFFNSAEVGCGTDPNVILCDDFEDGDWYTKDCDQANSSGGLLQVDGWCGSIYNNPITPPGAASCNGTGANGTNCAASSGYRSGTDGNMATHEFAGGPVTELWARWYYKTVAGYQWGAEKHTNFTKAAGDITWFNIQFNCGTGSAQSTAIPSIQILHGSNLCQAPNVSSINLQSGRWYFFEVHAKLNSSGTVADGLIEMWINDCGSNGVCTGTPTLRTRMTNVRFDRNQSECMTSPCKIEVLWFENWANPTSTGTGYWDQIKVSKTGPIGFMP